MGSWIWNCQGELTEDLTRSYELTLYEVNVGKKVFYIAFHSFYPGTGETFLGHLEVITENVWEKELKGAFHLFWEGHTYMINLDLILNEGFGFPHIYGSWNAFWETFPSNSGGSVEIYTTGILNGNSLSKTRYSGKSIEAVHANYLDIPIESCIHYH